MASGYPPEAHEKTPQYTPYPAPVYQAPGYGGSQDPSYPSTLAGPSAPPPTPQADTSSTTATEQRRLSTGSYDEVFRLSKPVEVTFKEVFREAKGSESPEVIFNINSTIFTWTSRGLYTFLSVVLGIFLSIIWGIAFGALNFVVTWFCQPALKMLFILLRIVANALAPVWHTFLDPFFQSWGYVFSKIRGAFSLNVNGLTWPRKETRRAVVDSEA